MKKIYISGKITGIEAEAENLFNETEKQLIDLGYEVVNPLKLNHASHDKSWEAYMKVDIKALCDCDSIYMLSNYKASKGALIELLLATVLKLNVIYEKKQLKKSLNNN